VSGVVHWLYLGDGGQVACLTRGRWPTAGTCRGLSAVSVMSTSRTADRLTSHGRPYALSASSRAASLSTRPWPQRPPRRALWRHHAVPHRCCWCRRASINPHPVSSKLKPCRFLKQFFHILDPLLSIYEIIETTLNRMNFLVLSREGWYNYNTITITKFHSSANCPQRNHVVL